MRISVEVETKDSRKIIIINDLLIGKIENGRRKERIRGKFSI